MKSLENDILHILYLEAKKTEGNLIRYNKEELKKELKVEASDDEFDLATKSLIDSMLIQENPPIKGNILPTYNITIKGFALKQKT